MEEDEIHALTAPYALGALDAVEEGEFEAHLARCPTCRGELASLRDAASSLAYAVEAPAPPPRLRARILEQARGERPNVVPLLPHWAFRAPAAAAALAATVAVALGIWAASLSSQLDDERAVRANQERALAALAQPGTKTIALEGAEGTLVVAPSGRAALVISGLESAPEDKTYQTWVIEAGRPKPAGTFQADEDRTVVALARSVPDDAVVAVTLEDEGGAEQPSGAPLFTAEAL